MLCASFSDHTHKQSDCCTQIIMYAMCFILRHHIPSHIIHPSLTLLASFVHSLHHHIMPFLVVAYSFVCQMAPLDLMAIKLILILISKLMYCYVCHMVPMVLMAITLILILISKLMYCCNNTQNHTCRSLSLKLNSSKNKIG